MELFSGMTWILRRSPSTRPNNPAVIEAIRDFTDPIRPLLVFYPLNVFLTSPVTVDPQVVTTASGLDAVVNFSMGGAVTLLGADDFERDRPTYS